LNSSVGSVKYVSSAKAQDGANVTSPASELVNIVRRDASACKAVVDVRRFIQDGTNAAAGAAVARNRAVMMDFIVVDCCDKVFASAVMYGEKLCRI
jgi:hypothetical protein